MIPKRNLGDAVLSADDWKRIDAVCDGFETAWNRGERPDLALSLAGASEPLRSRLFGELLMLELEFRLMRADRPEADEYQVRFPEHRDVVETVFAEFGPAGKTMLSAPGGESLAWASAEAIAKQATEFGVRLPAAELSDAAREALLEAGYQVLGELGRGGMGVVYLARKLALNRLCALKMILAGAHAGSAVSARFRAEAETVARLQHPDIVQIFHVGEAAGLPYLELEYLPGGSLDKTMTRGTPRPPADAARLVGILAHAIDEAHRQGIIHRDLKPANILLDLQGHPKVADFGLAKLLDSDDGLTKTHTVLGSPSYMAPEQAEGLSQMVGVRTDVYALGAIFYELLTGRPPFRAATALETFAQVKGSDPVPPSQFQMGLARDVETICLKCLEKAPARRYPSAAALAEDLRRYQAGEPILSRPASPWERVRKWSRSRPTLAAAVAVGSAAVVLLLGGALYYNAQLQAAVRKARAAEQAAVDQRNLAVNALNQLVFGAQEKLGAEPATRPMRQGLLDTAIAGLDEIARSAEESVPNLSRAAAHQKLGEIYRQIGRTSDARRQLNQALTLTERLAEKAPTDLAIADCQAKAHLGLGEMEIRADRPEQAKVEFRHAVDRAEAIVAANPGREGARRGLIEAYLQLGRAYGFGLAFAEAEAWFRKTRDLAQQWAGDEPRNPQPREMLSWSYRKIADMRKHLHDSEGARREYLKAIDLVRALVAAEPANAAYKEHLAITLDDLAGVAFSQHRSGEARPEYEESERLFTELADADSQNFSTQLRLLRVQEALAKLERADSRLSRASDLLHRALERIVRLQRERRLTDNPPFWKERIATLERLIAECDRAAGAKRPTETNIRKSGEPTTKAQSPRE